MVATTTAARTMIIGKAPVHQNRRTSTGWEFWMTNQIKSRVISPPAATLQGRAGFFRGAFAGGEVESECACGPFMFRSRSFICVPNATSLLRVTTLQWIKAVGTSLLALFGWVRTPVGMVFMMFLWAMGHNGTDNAVIEEKHGRPA